MLSVIFRYYMQMRLHTIYSFALTLLLVCAGSVFAQNYPHIQSLVSRKSNFMFQQYQEEVQAANKALRANHDVYLNFYTYTVSEADYDTLLDLYARCSVPYDSIASLNRLPNKSAPIDGLSVLLPTVAGLYIPLVPKSEIEILMASEYSVQINNGAYPVYHINGDEFYFIKGGRFSPEVRAFFVNPGMALPLDNFRLTSPFGMRVSPISGKWRFHKGIDMAASVGTPVMACKAGVVQYIGTNDYTYGNYIILKHEDGMTSLYAHLSYIYENIKVGTPVSRRQAIGKVGQTGLATGPHLHFEIKVNGENEDPQQYLNKK